MSSKKLSVAEIKELRESIQKANAESRPADVKGILAKLKAGVEPSEDVIRATKIGQTIGSLRKHADKGVADAAKELVQGWKAEVDKQRAAANKKEGGGAANGVKEDRKGSATPVDASKSASPAATPTNGASTPETSTAPVKLDFERLGDKTRDVSLKVIYTSLTFAGHATAVDASAAYARALEIEAAVFEKLVGSKSGSSSGGEPNADYRNKMRSLSLNLKDKNNPALRESVMEGSIAARRLVEMRPEEMASDAMKREREQLQMQNLFNAKAAEEQQAETDAFTCPRCKAKKCYYRQQQTRSADEPMTTFVTCTNCRYKWKFC